MTDLKDKAQAAEAAIQAVISALDEQAATQATLVKRLVDLQAKGGITVSQLAKEAGLDSLKQVAAITGVSTSTLNDWHESKHDRLRALLLGARVIAAAEG